MDTESPIGTAVCGDCGEYVEVYVTPTGLLCDDCLIDTVDTSQPTYSPTLREPTEPESVQELEENVESFTEKLPDFGFDVALQDGSTWEMDRFDSHAVLMKYGDEWEEYLPALASEIATHFERRSEPSRFGGTVGWGGSKHDDSQDEYETHAELAPVVAYADLRSAKMQLGFMALSDDADDPLVDVIGIGDDEFHKYTAQGRITVELSDEDASTGGDSE